MLKSIVVTGLSLVVLVAALIPARAQDTTATQLKEEVVATGAAVASLHVKRGSFTSAVLEREPVDQLDSLATDVDKILFFTEIVDMAGKTVTHRWIFDGETVAEVPFEVGGPRWRVYSSKRLIPSWTGTWKVVVVDEEGNQLFESSFVYFAAAQ